ncbi:hypothetical protein ACFQQB_15130 [Nonomuraea rubra]|uniref:hypothetical protein n=1 Tax=Nonomuraea rubra TaxID=46180 RepID=UPI0036241C97
MCDDPLLPPAVAAALADYRSLRDTHDVRWGEPPLGYVVQAWATVFLDNRYGYWAAALRQIAGRHPGVPPEDLEAHLGEVDPDRVVRDALAGDVLDNLAALRLTPEGACWRPRRRWCWATGPSVRGCCSTPAGTSRSRWSWTGSRTRWGRTGPRWSRWPSPCWWAGGRSSCRR